MMKPTVFKNGSLNGAILVKKTFTINDFEPAPSGLHLEHLTKIFTNGSRTLTVLDSVTYTFKANSLYCITGPSGSGKSTLLHALACLEAPTSGSIWFDGRDLVNCSAHEVTQWRKAHVGMMFQLPYLINELTVLDNVALAGRIAGQSKDQSNDRAVDLLKEVGLSPKLLCSPVQLSGGEQQRVALARALIKKPTLIIADEPTAHLDVKTRQTIKELLCRYVTDHGTTCIIATHDCLFYERIK